MAKFVFSKDGWDRSKLARVYSPVEKTFVPFTEEENCIVSVCI